jgi:hypothetical protein
MIKMAKKINLNEELKKLISVAKGQGIPKDEVVRELVTLRDLLDGTSILWDYIEVIP